MKAQNIMTRDVVTIKPNASVHEAATLMAKHRISGIPVTTAARQLLGIVSEGDLLERVEVGAEPKASKWWLDGFSNAQALASRYVKAHGATVADVMTRQVATVRPDAELDEVADVLQGHRVKRVPVVQDGKLLGIVTRSDIVKAVSGAMGPGTGRRSDADLQRAILERMRTERWLDTSYVNLNVTQGKVNIHGLIGSAEERRALYTLVEELAGSGNVIDHLKVGLPLVTEF